MRLLAVELALMVFALHFTTSQGQDEDPPPFTPSGDEASPAVDSGSTGASGDEVTPSADSGSTGASGDEVSPSADSGSTGEGSGSSDSGATDSSGTEATGNDTPGGSDTTQTSAASGGESSVETAAPVGSSRSSTPEGTIRVGADVTDEDYPFQEKFDDLPYDQANGAEAPSLLGISLMIATYLFQSF